MPAPIFYAHKILRLISEARHSGKEKVLGPDSKSQVTVQYENGKPVGVTRDRRVAPASRRGPDLEADPRHRRAAMSARRCRKAGSRENTIWHINPTGKFFIGGPDGDAGLTGRKIIVDTYGGAAPHGGGAFSGKDPTKVDRSAAYAARYLAKNVVAAGVADRCTLQLAYAIGVARPLSIYIDTHGTGKVRESKLETIVAEAMDLDAARHPQASRSQQADLRAHLVLRPFRPPAGQGRRLLLGEDRHRRRVQARRQRRNRNTATITGSSASADPDRAQRDHLGADKRSAPFERAL